jgi:GNAT superfamily N-acetyltransferase
MGECSRPKRQRAYLRRIVQPSCSLLGGRQVSRTLHKSISSDVTALRDWHWLGFGLISVDALHGLDPIQGYAENVTIRRAELLDLEHVMELHEDLWQNHKDTPIFHISEKRDRAYYEEWLGNPYKVVWLAYLNDEPVVFMSLGPADDAVCTIIYDEKTTIIYAAFTNEKVRKKGIATALPDHAVKTAQVLGYERCAISFKPMNLLAMCFWLKYFTPVCLTIVRYIDDL